MGRLPVKPTKMRIKKENVLDKEAPSRERLWIVLRKSKERFLEAFLEDPL